MSPERDELQDLWRRAERAAEPVPSTETLAAPPPRTGPLSGRAMAARLRRRVRRDGWIKLAAIPFLLAAISRFAHRLTPAAAGVLGFSLLAVLLGVAQIAWSGRWREADAASPLREALVAGLAAWRRRRTPLALLLGATPALAWQVYQLAYLAMSAHRPGPPDLVNLLFLIAGGPVIWLASAWMHRARLDAWLLQLEQTLQNFDEESAAACRTARRRADRRLLLLAAFFLLLLLGGTLLFWFGR